MQCQALPIKVCDQVDKLIRDFLWGSTEEKRRIHLVCWDKVTLPKELGGLGLYKMKERNYAILAKLCWRLAWENEAPWAQLLAAKYLTANRMTNEGRKLPCSSCWTACKKGGPIYVKGLKWSVKNGETVKVWTDFWLPMGTLRSLIEGPCAVEKRLSLLSNVLIITKNGRLDVYLLSYLIIFSMPLKLLLCLAIMRQKTRFNGPTLRMVFSP